MPPKVPYRTSQSPCIVYANFAPENGRSVYVNLIRLYKPYASGVKYVIYNATSVACKQVCFKDYDRAKKAFHKLVGEASKVHTHIKSDYTGNCPYGTNILSSKTVYTSDGKFKVYCGKMVVAKAVVSKAGRSVRVKQGMPRHEVIKIICKQCPEFAAYNGIDENYYPYLF